jgi:hypothetical protein
MAATEVLLPTLEALLGGRGGDDAAAWVPVLAAMVAAGDAPALARLLQRVVEAGRYGAVVRAVGTYTCRCCHLHPLNHLTPRQAHRGGAGDGTPGLCGRPPHGRAPGGQPCAAGASTFVWRCRVCRGGRRRGARGGGGRGHAGAAGGAERTIRCVPAPHPHTHLGPYPSAHTHAVALGHSGLGERAASTVMCTPATGACVRGCVVHVCVVAPTHVTVWLAPSLTRVLCLLQAALGQVVRRGQALVTAEDTAAAAALAPRCSPPTFVALHDALPSLRLARDGTTALAYTRRLLAQGNDKVRSALVLRALSVRPCAL